MIELPKDIGGQIADDLEIRRATEDDLPEVLRLLRQLHDAPSLNFSTNLESVFHEILSSPSRAVLVAMRNRAALGTVDFFVLANLTRGGRPWAGIENLVVDTHSRREGIGGALLSVVVDLARQLGCYKLQLVSHERRGEAHDLYSQAGFDAPVHGYRLYL